MNIKEEFGRINHTDITKEYINFIKTTKNGLSNSDKRYLLSIIGRFKNQDINETLKAIKIYAIWEPNESIIEARKKGVFRYKAYGFKKNQGLYLLNNLIEVKNLFMFSENTNKFLNDKKSLCWLYEFYKSSEEKLIQNIICHHNNRLRIKKDNYIIETALFKELLAYIDIEFYHNLHSYNKPYFNKNILNEYSKEDICDGISYIIFLYDKIIGIKQDAHYFVDPKYVLSDEIKKIILVACKVIEIQEWELCIDYFNYKIKVVENMWTFYDESTTLGKSVQMGFIRRDMQQDLFYISSLDELKDSVSIKKVGENIEDDLANMFIKEISDGKLSRYRFEFPEPLIAYFGDKDKLGKGLFCEEIISLEYCAKELIMTFEETSKKKITKNCNLNDIILFQRFFFINE